MTALYLTIAAAAAVFVAALLIIDAIDTRKENRS